MNRIRLLGMSAALGAVVVLSGCVAYPVGPGYSGAVYSDPYYVDPGPVYVAPPSVVIGGSYGYYGGRSGYYGRPWYGRPGWGRPGFNGPRPGWRGGHGGPGWSGRGGPPGAPR
jgi:hypothetical protein